LSGDLPRCSSSPADDADSFAASVSAPARLPALLAMHRAGKVNAEDIETIEGNLATTAGTCAVMGTASTMASIAEALAWAAETARRSAVHADRLRAAEESGRRAAALAQSPIRPSQIVTEKVGRERAAHPARDRARPTRSCT